MLTVPLEKRAVRLETADGQLVHEGVIVPYTKRPDVILWGWRLFRHHADTTYREATFHVLADDAGIKQMVSKRKRK